MKHLPLLAKTLLAGAIAAALLALIFTPFASNSTSDLTNMRSEKSKRMDNQGHPDLFAEYHKMIREGENGKAYAINYKYDELARARSARKSPGRQLPWLERGPGNVGGRTRAIVVDADDPTYETWFAGAVGGGIWHTTNAGASWRAVTDDLPNLAVVSMVQSPSNTDILYAGTGEGFGNFDGIAGAGVFKSIDHGETWLQLASSVTDDFRFVNRMIVSPDDDQVVLAATNTGVFRSVNGGDSWSEVYDAEPFVQDLKYQPGNFSIQFAAVNGCCIMRSMDAGLTWDVSNDIFFNGGARIELATSMANPDWVYAAVEIPGRDIGGDVYFTMDAGDTWTLAKDIANTSANDWLFGQGWYDNAIAVHPYAPDSVLLGGIELWRTHLEGSETESDGAPTAFRQVGTEGFLTFVNFTGSHFGGLVDVGTEAEQVFNVTLDDLTSVEIRFGPGNTQMAHRFTVEASGGTNGDGGSGVLFLDYAYEDYVAVPFEVWDVDNNRQLMASFRDQADDGVYNLLNQNTSGSRNGQSREYLFVHAVPYDEAAPDAAIGQEGGIAHETIYFMWPVLPAGSVWDPDNLPESQLELDFSTFEARQRRQLKFPQPLESGSQQVHVDHHDITIIPVNAENNEFKMIVGTDGGVFYSENSGGIWKDTRNGYNTAQFYDADKRPGANDYIAGAQDNGTWRSFNNPDVDSDWRSVAGGDGFEVFIHPDTPDKAIYSFQFNNFILTNDGGFSSSLSTTGLGDVGQGSGPFFSSLGWSKTRPDVVFAVGNTGVWRSDDFSENWTLAQAIPAEQWGFFLGCKVRVSIANPDYVWAGCTVDGPIGDRTLHLSSDGGQTFTPVTKPPIPEGARRITGLATHPTLSNRAYVLFSGPGDAKILQTSDFGETWTDLSGFGESTDGNSTNGFPDVAVYDLLVLPNTPSEIWAATEIGIFSSTDSGATWQFADNGLPAVAVWRLRVVDDQVIAATHGRGVWTVTEPFEVANETEDLPATFALSQNYPNPFNPQTTIDFTVPVATDVELKIFDVSGREVATLADGFFPAGAHNVSWNADQFASGVYVYRMTAGDYSAVQRMTLVK